MKKRKTKKSRGGFGTFFFGSFIGFLSCLVLIAGLGCFVYFKVSPAWINKTFKTNIDLGTEEANKMTLNHFVSHAIGLAQNYDSYKLGSLEADFGIKLSDELMGIDISDLKEVELSKLSMAIEKKFSNISAGELKNIPGMNLADSMGKILDKKNTYYLDVNNNKLYKDKSCTIEVGFEYTINEHKTLVIIKGKEWPIVSNQVKIILWDLPLTSAFGDFIGTMGDNLTLAELENDFGVQLPSFLNNVDKVNTTVNGLEEAINKLYVADILGYTIDNSDPDNVIVKDDKQQKVTGVMFELAIEKIENLKNIESKFGGLTGADLESTMNLQSLSKILNKTNTYYVAATTLYSDKELNNEVEFNYEISGKYVFLDDQSFEIKSGKVEITLKNLPLATAISDFTKNLGGKLTLEELKQDYGVILPSYIYNGNESKTINEIESIIDNIYVANILGYTISGDDVKNGDDDVTGIIAIIAKKKVSELNDIQTTIEGLTIATLLDYEVIVDDTNPENIITTVKDREGRLVTGLLEKIAPYTIKNVDDAIDCLTLGDVFDTETLKSGVFKLFNQSQVGSIKIINIATDLQNAIDNSTLSDLQTAGLIDSSYNLNLQIDTNLDGEKDTLMAGMYLNEFIEVAIFILSK